MNTLPITELKRLSAESLTPMMPLKVLKDNIPWAVLAPIDGVIVISDLHPAVQNQFKMKENRVRSAMGIKDIRPDYVVTT